MRKTGTGIIAGLVLLSGCVGAPEGELAYAAPGLVEVAPDTEPLPPLDAEGEDWETAHAGCEDLLDGDVTIHLASAVHGLVAAVDGEGHIVCVDTIEAVREELEEEGQGERAEELGEQFTLAAQIAMPDMSDVASGRPSPQPNVNTLATTEDPLGKNPSPQPNMDR